MNLVRIGIALIIIGLVLLFIPNVLLTKVYSTVSSTLGNITVSLDTYSEFLMPIYVSNPAYLIVSLNNSHLPSMYLLDEFGHVLKPLSYRHEYNLYLVIFPLIKNGNYSLVIFNGYPEELNISLSITMVYQYIVNKALLMSIVMALGVVVFVSGAVIIIIKALGRALYRALNGLKI